MAQRPFITTWKTDNPGESITIPVNPDVTGYNYTVDWGDDSPATNHTNEDAIHTYAAAGTYTVTISGDFPAIRLGSYGDVVSHKLMSIEQWGDIAWKSMDAAFSGAKYMELNASDIPDLGGVSSLSRMFFGAELVNDDLSGWEVSAVTDMSSMFYSAFAFNGDITGWDVSNVTNMFGMFWQASLFNQNIGSWDVSRVEDMSFMFYSAVDFNQDLSGWDVSRVTTMNSMFFIALDFNQSLGSWDISSVTDMDDMLLSTGLSSANYGATLIGWAALPTVPSDITLDATGQEYCVGSPAETARQELEMKRWNIIGDDPATDCDGDGVAVTPGDPGNFITTWQFDDSPFITELIIPTHPEETYNYAVYWESDELGSGSASGVTGDYVIPITPGRAGTVKVEITGQFPRIFLGKFWGAGPMENGASQLLSVDQWGDIAWTSMEEAFRGATNLQVEATDLPDLSGVTSLKDMFDRASNFTGNSSMADWDVANITDMSGMFCVTKFNQPIGGWNVSNVTNIQGMFNSAPFNQYIGDWNVANVVNMNELFANNGSFNQDIGGWDVSNVQFMDGMFRNAVAFNQDISGWDVSAVIIMLRMFLNAAAFDQDLGNWRMTNVGTLRDAFSGSGLSMTNYDATLVGWAARSGLQQDVPLGANGLKFCDGAEARQSLIDDYGWNITGDVPACASMLIFVETEDGKTLVILTEGSDAIQQLKYKIQDKAGIQVGRQQLFFAGNELEDGRTLNEYAIGNGTTLQLVLVAGSDISPDSDNILYVDINVNTAGAGYTGAGDSWATAVPQLADALKWAREQHDGGSPGWTEAEPLRIFVAKGTYKPLYHSADGQYTTDGGRDNSFVLVPNVQLYGGFDPSAGIETLEDPRILPAMNSLEQGTILSGDFNGNDNTANYDNHTENAHHVTIASGNVGSALMDGFTVTGGYATGNASGPSVMGRTVYRFFGGGTYIISSSPQFTHMAWFNNLGEWGGGLYNSVSLLTEISSPALSNVTFYRNMAPGGGGGIRNFGGSVDIKQAIFAHNGAGLVEDGTSSGPGGGIYSSGNSTSLSITNATFSGNWIVGAFIPSFDGAAIQVEQTSTQLNNVVIWGNEVEGDTADPSASISISLGGDVTVANSLVAHSGGSANWNNAMGILDGGNNIDADPMFVSTTPGEAGYLQLSACSPAISGGSNQLYIDAGGNPANDLDMGGNPRVYNFADDGVIDMGAYEYQGERIYIEQLTMPDAVQVAYGTEMGDIESLPTTVIATLSDERDVSIPLDGNLANWTLASPAGGTYDGDVAGTYVFTVPLLIPETECYLNPESLAAEVTVAVAKGTPVLAASWNGTAIDVDEGLSLTYGDIGELALSTTDPEGELTYAFSDDDMQVLDLANLEAVAAQQAGTATLTIEQEETDNFEAAAIEIAVTVAQKPIVIVAAADQGKVYGADEPAVYGYALAEGDALAFDDELMDVVSVASREAGEHVGAYHIELEFEGGQANNYAITFESANNAFVIIPLEITVTAADKTKVFDTDDPALTYTFSPELIGGDEFTGELSRDPGEDTGKYAITQGDLSLGDNYTLIFEPGLLTITAAEYEGIAFEDLTVTYDGTEHALELTGELPEGTTVSYEIDDETGNAATDADIYEVTAFIDGGDNYEDAELTATLTITPLEITVTAEDRTKVFGADDPALTYTYAPELIDDDKFTGVLSREDGEDVGSYAITQGDLSLSDNYDITFEAGTMTITAEEYEGITLENVTVTYDGREHVLELSGDVPDGATVTYEIDGEAGNGATDAGTYQVTAYIDGGTNYEDAELTATLTITPREIKVRAENQSKVFGTGDPALTYSSTPELIGDDTFEGGLDREEGEDVGSYAITQGNLSLSDNYTVIFEPATLTVTQRQITGIIFENTSFTYDGTEHRLALVGDLPAGASVTYENNGRTNVGNQTVRAVIDGNGQYADKVLEATLTVLPATRTLDFPPLSDRTYGDANFDAGASTNSGETLSYTSSEPGVAEVTSDGEITIISAGETTITVTVPENANYTNRPQVGRTLTVRKASQTIALDGPAEADRDAGSIDLTTSSTSGLPVVLTGDNAEVATLEGNTLSILRLGRITVTATQAGDDNHEAAEPVTLTIRVIDPTSDLPVRVHPVISPNGDGINEFLMIEAVTDYPENRVTIFNRNGTLLWEANGYDNNRVAFRGMSTGQLLLPAGTYFYIVEVKDGNTWKHKKGYFVLRY